jgi:peptidoglycan L-alanyl-D-glutamate endopeptidase CwlK
MSYDYTFSKRSLGNLRGVHPALAHVTARALQLTRIDFTVVEGKRSRARQQYLVNTGKSMTMNSAHLTGCAVDCYPIVNGQIEVRRIPPFIELSKAFLKASDELGIPIRWGGDWNRNGDYRDERFLDCPHFELERTRYDWKAAHPAKYTFDRDIIDLLRLPVPA